MRLLLNNTEMFRVSSRKSWNETELEVFPNEEYEFMAIGHWNDLLISSSGANGYSNSYMRPLEKLKRSPMDNWFALMGSINKKFDFLVGGYKKLVFDMNGKLSFYANDVPGLYWNNSSSISLFVTRLR